MLSFSDLSWSDNFWLAMYSPTHIQVLGKFFSLKKKTLNFSAIHVHLKNFSKIATSLFCPLTQLFETLFCSKFFCGFNFQFNSTFLRLIFTNVKDTNAENRNEKFWIKIWLYKNIRYLLYKLQKIHILNTFRSYNKIQIL